MQAPDQRSQDAGEVFLSDSCPACTSSDIEFHFAMRGYRILRCRTCRHGFVDDAPSRLDLAEFNRDIFGERLRPRHPWHRRLKYWMLGQYLKRLLPAGKPIRLLEIGCSQGDLLHALARDDRITAEGIDVADGAVEYARSRGLSVTRGSLDDAGYPDGHFDVVVSIHTFEHLPDPERALRSVRRILAPGGYFYAVVPCATHWRALRKGRNWKHWAPPAHLSYFSRESFRALFARLDFRVVYALPLATHTDLRVLAQKP